MKLFNVLEAGLPTAEIMDIVADEVKKFDGIYWLKDRGDDEGKINAILSDGSFCSFGGLDVEEVALVRPMLKIEILNDDLQVGDFFIFHGLGFEIINKNTALCTQPLTEASFNNGKASRFPLNSYANSTIKNIIDEWFVQY